MTLRKQISITVALAVLLGGGWYWLAGPHAASGSNAAAPKRAAATPVLVEPVSLADDTVKVRAIGTGTAIRSATIYPSVSGEVMEVAFRPGTRVEKGAPLVRLDAEHQGLAVRLAEVAMKEAKRQAERLEKLVPRGAASAAQLETAQAEYDSARVRLEQTWANLRDRTVHAPFDGIIGLTDIDRGDRITSETAIATLDDPSSILVEFSLPEEYAGQIKVGDTVRVRPWTMRDRLVDGTISVAGSRIDPVTRTLQVKARIENPDLSIRPGTSFEVEVAFSGKRYPTIPEVAVLWSRDGAYLWRVKDKRAEKVFVSIVRRDRGRILVDGDLREGDMIVVEGVQGLRPNQLVKTALYDPARDGASPKPGLAAPKKDAGS